MSCSCHINPPCPWCEKSFECHKCFNIFNEEDEMCIEYDGETYCEECSVGEDR